LVNKVISLELLQFLQKIHEKYLPCIFLHAEISRKKKKKEKRKENGTPPTLQQSSPSYSIFNSYIKHQDLQVTNMFEIQLQQMQNIPMYQISF